MKRIFSILFYSVILLAGIIAFVLLGKFVFYDCAAIIKNFCSDEIRFSMALSAFFALGTFLPSSVVEFVQFCKSSGSSDDK